MSARASFRHAGSALALAAALGGPACDGMFVDPAPSSSAAVSVSFLLTAAAGGEGQAFDRADAARLRLVRRDGGGVALDQAFDLSPNVAGREVSAELELNADPETFDLSVQLLAGTQQLFTGTTAVTVRKGQTTDAEVQLQPVIASVGLSQASANLAAINQTLTLQAWALFASGDTVRSVAVQWLSQNPAIATVSATGLLTARAEGQTQVVASAGSLSASVQVRVQPVVSTVTVQPAGDTLVVGEVLPLSAVARDANGNALTRTFAWASTNAAVATVDGAGRVTALSPGTVIITATADGKVGSSSIRVSAPPVTSVAIVPGSATVSVGATVPLQAETRTATGQLVTRPVTWTSGNNGIATVSASGVVTGVAAGTVTITAWCEGVSGTAQITVVAPVLSVTPTSLAFSGVQGGANPVPQALAISNTGGGTLDWNVADDAAWLSLTPPSGTGAGSVSASVSLTGLTAGTYNATITITANAANAPRTVPVTLAVSANPGQIQGRVTDVVGLPLAGAQVSVVGTAYAATANATGDYVVAGLPPGTYSVSAAATGYVTQVVPNVTVTAGQATPLSFQLAVASPAPPASLTATAASSSQIDLLWTDASNNETGFRIERCTGAGCSNFAEIATVGANVTGYPNTGLAAGTSYSYRARAYNAGGNSAYSNTATTSTQVVPPNGPTGLTAAPFSATQANIAWTDNASNESGFRIERCTGSGCTGFVEIATVSANVTSYQNNSGLSGPNTYTYRVRAYNAAGNSPYSGSAEATTPVPDATTLPSPPSSLALTAASYSQIDVSWKDNATNEVGWRHERCSGAGCSNFVEVFVPTTVSPATTPTLTTNYTGMSQSTSYSYRVRTYNRVGNSAYSNTATVVTPNPSLTAPSPPSGLTATAVSRRQVTVSWTDNSFNETGVAVERCFGAGCAGFVQIGTVSYANQTSFRDTTATTGSYQYRVRAFNGVGNSTYSNNAVVTTVNAATPPAAPSGLTTTPTSTSQINLGWTDGSTNEDGFYIERCTCSGYSCTAYTVIATTLANVTGWSVTGHSSQNIYSYRVRAFNTAGNSAYSNVSTGITW